MIRRLVGLLVALVPPLVLLIGAGRALVHRIDAHLQQLTPIAAAEASAYLGRDVTLGRIATDLSVRTLWGLWRHPTATAVFPLALEEIALANRPEERALAGSPQLARARRVTLYISLPGLRGGRAVQEALPRIVVEDPELVLVRQPDGRFNVERILPKPTEPPDITKPAFQTSVVVDGGKVRFRDYQAFPAPPGTPRRPTPRATFVDNFFDRIAGTADLSRPDAIRFDAAARPQPGTATARRLTGTVTSSGTVARGEPGARPDSPEADSALYLIHARAQGAQAAYWLPYALRLDGFRVTAGRADVSVTVFGPRGATPSGPRPPAILRTAAQFAGAAVDLPTVAEAPPITDITGSLIVDDSVLTVAARGTSLGEPVRVRGSLWNLQPAAGAVPTVYAQVELPRAPVGALLARSRVRLPVGLTVGSEAALRDVIVSGPLTDPAISAEVRDARVGWKGFPSVHVRTARVLYAHRAIAVDGLIAAVDGGGTLTGSALIPLQRTGDGLFQIRATQLDLAQIAALRTTEARLRLSGRVGGDVVGTLRAGAVTLGANLRAEAGGLRLGQLAIPDAAARVRRLADGTLALDTLRLASPAGIVTARGSGSERRIAFRALANGIDLAAVGGILGQPDLAGLASASAQITGTLARPRITVSDLVALNPRFGPSDGRRLALDTVRSERLEIVGLGTPAGPTVLFDLPLRLRRFPALVSVTGRVGALGPLPGKTIDPILALSARVTNLDVEEVLRQVGGVQSASGGDINASALVTEAQATITGTGRRPLVAGTVRLGRLLLGPYPVDDGEANFVYDKGAVSLSEIRLTASIGEVTGGLRLDRQGNLSGRLEAPRLQLESLSFLTQESIGRLGGALVVSAEIGGTREKPEIHARVLPRADDSGAVSTVEVAGTRLSQVSVPEIDLRADLTGSKPAVSIAVPSLSFAQESARVALSEIRYDEGTGRASATLAVTEGRLETLVATLRRSRLDETEAGARLLAGLDGLPAPFDGAFTLQANVAASLSHGRLQRPVGRATLTLRDLHAGPANASAVTATISLDDRRVTIDAFRAQLRRENGGADDAVIVAQRGGTLLLPGPDGGPVRFERLAFDALGTSLDAVRAFAPEFPLEGKVDLSASLEGTSERYQLTASVDGADLLYRPPLAQEDRPLPGAPPVAGPPSPGTGLEIARLRFELGLERFPDGRREIVVRDGLVRRGAEDVGDLVSFDADLSTVDVRIRDRGAPAGSPLRTVTRLAPDAPLTAQIGIQRLNVETLAGVALAAPGMRERLKRAGTDLRAGGALTGNVTVGGTFARPALGGRLTLANGRLRLANTSVARRDLINPITDLDLDIALDGNTVRIENARLALGAPQGRSASAGSLQVRGTVSLDNLAELVRPNTSGEAARLDGRFDLTARFDGFTPDAENVTALLVTEVPGGLGEAVRARLDGEVTISGPLERPRIASRAPLQLTQATLLLPRRPSPPPREKPAPVLNPEFAIEIAIPKGARVANAGSVLPFLFEANGSMQVTGSAADPRVRADLVATGGRLYYFSAPFRVKRDGRISLVYADRGSSVRVDELQAEASILWNGSLSYARRISQGGTFLDTFGNETIGASGALGSAQRVKVTATLNGPLDLLGDGTGREQAQVSLTSDPPLSQTQILALIGSEAQIQQIARGDAEGALRSGFQQVTNNYVIPRLLDPLTRSLADVLGLDDVRLDYNPDGTALVQITSFLPAPLQRVSVSLSRSFQTRGSSVGQPRPLLYSINYDLFAFRPGSRLQPRIQIGVSSNEQREVLSYLRGTISY
jgi:hypothetical protein